MKLIVKNFGAIKESVIDLSKRYYFFVGYNNTGKTYLAKLVYDIFNSSTLHEFTETELNKDIMLNENTKEYVLTKEVIENILNKFAAYLKDVVIPKSLKTTTNSHFILNNLDVKFDFDFEKDVQTPPLKSIASVGFKVDSSDTDAVEVYSIIKAPDSSNIIIEALTDDYIINKLSNDFFDNISKALFKDQLSSIKKSIDKNFKNSLLNLLFPSKQPFFLPANRIFILENADELVEQENKRNQDIAQRFLQFLGDKESNTVQFKDLLRKEVESNHTIHIDYLIGQISKLRKNKDEVFIQNGSNFYNDLIADLADVMGGEIVMDKINTISNWEEKFKITNTSQDKQPLQMYLASSSVNQLGILFLYLKYWAEIEQNFLMIDEPEENLHPKSQIKLINLLLKFANRGNRILVTTHSPLLAEIINNYLILSQLPERSEIAKKMDLVDIDLSTEKTGIYYFNGETVTEHSINSYGTIFSSFKEAQDNIYSIGEYLAELMYKHINN